MSGKADRQDLNGHAQRVNPALIENVDVTVETLLAETTMTIAQLNALTEGSVVSVDASLSDLVELRINGVKIAHGELVAVGDRFGVRITAIAS